MVRGVVDPARIVARDVLAVVGEVERRPEATRRVTAGEAALDATARRHAQALEVRDELGFEQARGWGCHGSLLSRYTAPRTGGLGAPTCARTAATASSAVTPAGIAS